MCRAHSEYTVYRNDDCFTISLKYRDRVILIYPPLLTFRNFSRLFLKELILFALRRCFSDSLFQFSTTLLAKLHFKTSVSYDGSYTREPCYQLLENIQSDVSVEPNELERYLKRIKPTSPGPDDLPKWFFHECSLELADIVSYVISQSLKSGIVPDQSKVVYVSPCSSKDQ